MGKWYKTRCASAVLAGLLLLAQIPLMLNICLGADGALHLGFGCQCPDCDAASATPLAEPECGCGAAACAAGTAESGEHPVLSAGACCTQVLLSQHRTTVLNQPLRLSKEPCQFVVVSTGGMACRIAALPAPAFKAAGWPPGRGAPAYTQSVILRI